MESKSEKDLFIDLVIASVRAYHGWGADKDIFLDKCDWKADGSVSLVLKMYLGDIGIRSLWHLSLIPSTRIVASAVEEYRRKLTQIKGFSLLKEMPNDV